MHCTSEPHALVGVKGELGGGLSHAAAPPVRHRDIRDV